MKTLSRLPCLLAVVLLTGCSAVVPEYKKVARIHVGMTRQEVLDSFGSPLKRVRNGSVEVLSYRLTETRARLGRPAIQRGFYFVITHDRVESFGRE